MILQQPEGAAAFTIQPTRTSYFGCSHSLVQYPKLVTIVVVNGELHHPAYAMEGHLLLHSYKRDEPQLSVDIFRTTNYSFKQQHTFSPGNIILFLPSMALNL